MQRHAICLLTGSLLAPACGETIDPAEGAFGDSSNYEGTGETGVREDVGPGELDPGECIADAKPSGNVWGYQYQCGGYFFAHLGITYGGEPYIFYIPTDSYTYYGDGHEPYAEAKVIACCGLTDPDIDAFDQPAVYTENCLLDFRQQACSSLATGLATLINDGTVPQIVKEKAIDVQHYLALHGDDCIAALMYEEDDSPYFLENARWDLPDDGPWGPQLSSVHIEIDHAIITDLHLPDQPITCDDLDGNNMYPFTPPSIPLINVFDVDLDEGGGGIVGPNRITANAAFASLSTNCTDPQCSYATFSTDGSDFAIDRLQLYVNGDLRVSNGTDSESISNVRLELYNQARGSITGGGRVPIVHTIPPGQAQFLVVGEAAGESVTIPVLTKTPIVAHETAGAWTLDPFSLEYVTDSGETWTVAVQVSDWL